MQDSAICTVRSVTHSFVETLNLVSKNVWLAKNETNLSSMTLKYVNNRRYSDAPPVKSQYSALPCVTMAANVLCSINIANH